MKNTLLSLIALCMTSSIVDAAVTFTFSEGPGGGTRMSVSGDGIIGGLSANATTSTASSTLVRLDNGATDDFDIRDFQATSAPTSNTDLWPLTNTLPADFLSGDISFSLAPETLIDYASNGIQGLQMLSLEPDGIGTENLVIFSSGTAPTSITFKTGYSIDSADPFSNISAFGTASWTTTLGAPDEAANTISVNVIPEPSSAALLGVCFLVLAGSRRRNQ